MIAALRELVLLFVEKNLTMLVSTLCLFVEALYSAPNFDTFKPPSTAVQKIALNGSSEIQQRKDASTDKHY